MKVTDSKGSRSGTYSEIDVFDAQGDGLPGETKREINQKVGEFLVEQIAAGLADGKTLVSGEGWPRLSKDYKEKKLEQGGEPFPNMELTGELLDSFTAESDEESVRIGFFDDQAWKADGHLKFSGAANNTPKRRFLPGKGQTFKPEIRKEIERIVADEILAQVEDVNLDGIESTSDLVDLLSSFFPTEIARKKVMDAVKRNAVFAELLEELDG